MAQKRYEYYSFPVRTKMTVYHEATTLGGTQLAHNFTFTISNNDFEDMLGEQDEVELTTDFVGLDLHVNSAGSQRGGLDVDYDNDVSFMIRVVESSAPTTAPNLTIASQWAQEGINSAFAKGLIPQSLQSQYTQATTRAEFSALAVALYEVKTGKEITERMEFNDTTDINVQKMGGLGVVTGVGDGKFAPNDTLTREQAAVMLARLANAIGQPLSTSAPTFADNGSISSWAVDNIGQIQAAGIMSGVGNNTFAPKQPYTREQSIVTMLRLFEAMK